MRCGCPCQGAWAVTAMRLPPLNLQSAMPDGWQMELVPSPRRSKILTSRPALFAARAPQLCPASELHSARRRARDTSINRSQTRAHQEAFEHRLAKLGQPMDSSIFTHGAHARLRAGATPDGANDDDIVSGWSREPAFVDALTRWERSLGELDGIDGLRTRLLERAALKDEADAIVRARGKRFDEHGRPQPLQRMCMCAMHVQRRGGSFSARRSTETVFCEQCDG